MKNSISLLLLSALLVLLSGCRKDNLTEELTVDRPPIINVDLIEAKLLGNVVDEMGDPVADASISWGATTRRSDERGIFIINGFVREKNAVLKIKKDGFFQAVQTVQVSNGHETITKVQLIPKRQTGSFQSSAGGTVEAFGGGTVEFLADGIVDASGANYEGPVNVFSFYLDPTRQDIQETMPGNLMALNAESTPQLLESFGMMNVELEDDQGNPLQLTKPATLKMPVPASLQGVAPSSIPLWYFDTADGLWKEEGSANLENGEYIGTVEHFTWWNCDVPSGFVFLNGDITPLAGSNFNFRVKMTNQTDGRKGVVNVTNRGTFSGFVPKAEPLLMEIFSICNDLIYSEMIGPFDNDERLPTITTQSSIDWKNFSGRLVDCNRTPVRNGYVSIFYPSLQITELLLADEMGDFSGTLPVCGDTKIIYTGVDFGNLLSGVPTEISLNTDVETGMIVACADELGGEFSMTVNGEVLTGAPCLMTITRNPDGIFQTYNIIFVHPQDNGTVIYKMNLGNFQNGSSTEYVSFSAFRPSMIIGNPERIYEYRDARPIDLRIEENSEIPGDTFHFTAKWDMRDIKTGEIIKDSDFDVKAIIQ